MKDLGKYSINGGTACYGTPLDGYKQSGNGREGGLIGLEEFQDIKTFHFA